MSNENAEIAGISTNDLYCVCRDGDLYEGRIYSDKKEAIIVCYEINETIKTMRYVKAYKIKTLDEHLSEVRQAGADSTYDLYN